MKSLKQLIINSPEYYLFAATVIYEFSATFINPIAIVLIVIITLQLIFKNKTTGLVLDA